MLEPDRVWAVVPVKLLPLAKSRLAPAMGQEERVSLCLRMLDHVLGELSAARSVGHLVVVSPDPRVLSLAAERGGLGIRDSGLDLNDALRQGIRAATSRGASAVLIVPADLPFLGRAELDEMVGLAREESCVVIARAASDGGTNALLLRPPNAIAPAFGPCSFERHCAGARGRGVPVHVFEAPGLALDLDTPDDLARVESHGIARLARAGGERP